jgi:hypothetical protein
MRTHYMADAEHQATAHDKQYCHGGELVFHGAIFAT